MAFSLDVLTGTHERTRGAFRFARELALAAGALWLVLWWVALLTYSVNDPAWSTSGRTAVAGNGFGAVGAWVADLSYFVLGYSVWWLVLAASWRWLRLVRRWARAPLQPPASRRWRRLGLALMVLSSAALEWSRLHSLDAVLPDRAGGLVGVWLGQGALWLFGFTGSALVLLALWLQGLAWWLNFRWAWLAERVGLGCTRAWQRLRLTREQREDERIGQQALAERQREAPADTGVEPTLTAAPIVIEPVQVAVAPSARVAKESQQALFDEPVQGTALPQVGLLDKANASAPTVSADTLEMTSRLIEKKLSDFGVEVKVVAAAPGPVITRYEIDPAVGVKGAQIVNLARDLARSLSLVSIRVIETIPGKSCMALELPNANRQTIRLSEILGSSPYHESKSLLTIGLGKDIVGHPVVADLAKMPHCLVAGTTGSGKSVGINAMILSLLYKADPRDVRLLLIDPKMLEMSVYEGIPHLLAPVVTDMRQAAHALNWCVAEMERRYKLMSKLGVRNLAGFNTKVRQAHASGQSLPNPFSLTPDEPEPLQPLPYLVVVIDELADLMMVVGKKVEELIARLAQKARAAGIHLVLATQRPSVDVITGLIKANIPTRIAFQVSSKIDSRTILDQMGAETLLGMGDMLYLPSGSGFAQRVHGAFVSDDEVHRVVAYLKTQGEPNYIDGVLEGGTVDGGDTLVPEPGGEADPMYDQAVAVVLKHRKASISLVQRHLKIGYNRAARMLEEMESAGLVSAMSGSGQREILVPSGGGESA